MKRNNKFYAAKKIRKVIEDSSWNYNLYYNIEQTDEYYHNGWFVTYVLREDVARRKDADNLKKLISLYFKDLVISSADHVRLIRKGIYSYKSKDGKTLHSLLPYPKWEFGWGYWRNRITAEISIPEELKKYFTLCIHKGKHTCRPMLKVPNYYFKVRIVKRYSNTIRSIDPIKQSEFYRNRNTNINNHYFHSVGITEARSNYRYHSSWDRAYMKKRRKKEKRQAKEFCSNLILKTNTKS